jgi:hypothetical protein
MLNPTRVATEELQLQERVRAEAWKEGGEEGVGVDGRGGVSVVFISLRSPGISSSRCARPALPPLAALARHFLLSLRSPGIPSSRSARR